MALITILQLTTVHSTVLPVAISILLVLRYGALLYVINTCEMANADNHNIARLTNKSLQLMRQGSPLYAFRLIMDNNDSYTAALTLTKPFLAKRLTALILANYVNSTTVVSITYGYNILRELSLYFS